VRERNWITFQAGEMRTCASCHGTNTANQAGKKAPRNKPQALRDLLNYWKTLAK
jgi:cytochrome c553